jgi:hypothetical protein
MKQTPQSGSSVLQCLGDEHTDRSPAIHKRTRHKTNLSQGRPPIGRLVMSLTALPLLVGIALAAEPLSDAQMDNLTAGRRGIAVPREQHGDLVGGPRRLGAILLLVWGQRLGKFLDCVCQGHAPHWRYRHGLPRSKPPELVARP